jgi:hypothetical protein
LKARSRRPVAILSITDRLKYEAGFKSQNLAGIIDWLETRVPVRDAIIVSAAASEPTFVISPNAIIGWTPVLPTNLKMLQKAGGVRKQFLEKQIAKSLDSIGLERMTGIRSDLQNVVQRNLLEKPSLLEKKSPSSAPGLLEDIWGDC